MHTLTQRELRRRSILFGLFVVIPLLCFFASFTSMCIRVTTDIERAMVEDVDGWVAICDDHASCSRCNHVIDFDTWTGHAQHYINSTSKT